MILGRATNLWVSVVGLLVNGIFYFHVLGATTDAPGLGIINAFAFAVIALIANTPVGPNTPTVLAGRPAK
jgi:hypothetical protein